MTRDERGFLWPAKDIHCAAVVFDSLRDLDVAYKYCRGFGVAVQAGGNCGVWPKAMAGKFAAIYTFEADPVNFLCLARNASELNVFKFNAALGSERKQVGMDRFDPHNAGAYQIDGAGSIPVLRIDDLGLNVCDLIYLDIEGYEFEALKGAVETIASCRPVIVVEDKGLSNRYGIPQGHIETWLAEWFGYSVAERVARDVILIPAA